MGIAVQSEERSEGRADGVGAWTMGSWWKLQRKGDEEAGRRLLVPMVASMLIHSEQAEDRHGS